MKNKINKKIVFLLFFYFLFIVFLSFNSFIHTFRSNFFFREPNVRTKTILEPLFICFSISENDALVILVVWDRRIFFTDPNLAFSFSHFLIFSFCISFSHYFFYSL